MPVGRQVDVRRIGRRGGGNQDPDGRAIRPSNFEIAIPRAFEEVVTKVLAKSPDNRYQTAAEVVAELERLNKFHGRTA